jgi:hypothetical protein
MISATTGGSTKKTEAFLHFLQSDRMFNRLDSGGRQGVDALSSATPVETGETAHAWSYDVKNNRSSHVVSWYNSHVEHGVNIATILQYGHGTGTGGYVAGRDYINPAMKPIFDRIVEDVWRQVTNG